MNDSGKRRVCAVYFSPTLTTGKIVGTVAEAVASSLSLNVRSIDLTPPAARKQGPVFSEEDIVIFGTPVYIGRVPNLIAPFFRTIQGGGADVAAIAVYGNRSCDEALAELLDILENDGFRTRAAASFIGEHAFSKILGGGRPDAEDLRAAKEFGQTIAGIISGQIQNSGCLDRFPGKGNPSRQFYTATDRNGKRIDIRKVKPVTDHALCNNCGYCASICPMGSIDPADCSSVSGICIKCSACVKRCPRHAKSFTDPDFLGHLQMLEEKFTLPRRQPQIYY